MKSIFSLALLALLLGATSPLSAQDSNTDVVYLKNGSVIRGAIIELVPNSTVKIRTADGSIFVYAMDDVLRIEKISTIRQRNPYGTHRRIAAWGLGSTMAATLVGSLAMDDEFFATTVIPIVGPFVTVVRIENDPSAYYRPGGKPLGIASGVLQTGFLIYFVTSWAKEKSFDARFSVLPSSDAVGFSMKYRF